MPRQLLPLPIDDYLPQVLDQVARSGALVLQAEPGAGKTTRIPPALLDAGLAELPGTGAGQIIVLQPRRIAARAAAMRISSERETELGGETGYQVRFERRSSRSTRILICTDGIFLRLLQDDPMLEQVSVVIFDEFHERSIDSDLALAMVRQVKRDLRPDLRIIVMSATLDTTPIASYLDGCPTLACPGASHPLEIEYLPFPASASTDRLAYDGVNQMLSRRSGHLLVFLPGIAEIRQTQALLQPLVSQEKMGLMTLYGDMPLQDQQQVLESSTQRKIILATNIAETSLTIDGVTTVVDSGLSRVNRLDSRLGLNRLDLQRISKASANQRAGRAARTAAGSCLRLWSEREHQMLREFEDPEISRVDLSQCLLQLFAWGETDVRSFPWFELPPESSLEQSLQLLDRLESLKSGQITDLGRKMSSLPLQPRLARLLVEGERLGHAKRAALCAALLSEREPFRRRSGERLRSEHHSDSDVLDRLIAIEEFANNGVRDSAVGEILTGPVKQVLRAGDQLIRLCSDRSDGKAPDAFETDSDVAIRKALLAAFPDRLCRRRDEKGRRALMVGGRGVRLGDQSAVGSGELFIAVELLDNGQAESVVLQASQVERSWLEASHLVSTVDAYYDSTKERVLAMRRLKFCDLIIDEAQVPLPSSLDPSGLLAKALTENFDIETLVDDEAKQYMTRIECLRAWMPQLGLADFGPSPWHNLMPEWCMGCTSVKELKSRSLVPTIQARLTSQQLHAVEKEAPSHISVPSGSRIKVVYESGKPPTVAVRIQEIFGMQDTPRIAGSTVPMLLQLLAPNYRVQQITDDLSNFWRNTYSEVRKDLRSRYPKHSWPEDPLTASAERRPRKPGSN